MMKTQKLPLISFLIIGFVSVYANSSLAEIEIKEAEVFIAGSGNAVAYTREDSQEICATKAKHAYEWERNYSIGRRLALYSNYYDGVYSKAFDLHGHPIIDENGQVEAEKKTGLRFVSTKQLMDEDYKYQTMCHVSVNHKFYGEPDADSMERHGYTPPVEEDTDESTTPPTGYPDYYPQYMP